MYDIVALYDGVLSEFDINEMAKTESIFDHFTYAGHELTLLNIMANKDHENDQKAEESYTTYFAHALKLINAFGVKTAEGLDAPLSLRNINYILEALVALDDPDNIDVVDELMTHDDSSGNIILARMIAELTEVTFGEAVEWIGEVDPALLLKLKDLSSTTLIEEDIISRTRMIVERYRSLMQDSKTGPVYDFVVTVSELPLTRDQILSNVSEGILELTDNDLIAINLLAIEVLAATPDEIVVLNAQAVREELFPTGRDIVDSKAEAFFKEFLDE